jgi:NAD-dependent DNA ligase
MMDQLKNRIKEANEAYRIGKPVMSDSEYDILLEELAEMSSEDELLSIIGHEILDETRKTRLPIPMASMNKIKTLDEIKDWQRLKLIPNAVEIICTPKYDGLSLCVDEVIGEAITRGDGVYGQRSTEHYRLIGNHLDINNIFSYSYGEVIMPKQVFLNKYSNDFANPRNLVAGLINSKTVSESLRDCNFIKYGAVATKNTFTTKKELLDSLNERQETKVPYHVCGILDLTEELLISLFKEWSQEYEIDGIILEVNNLATQESLGRETSSGNPLYAVAFKHESFEQKAETEVIGIKWNISKNGNLCPVINVSPVKLDGVTISNVTGNNARFVKDMGIGIGSIVKIVRSGLVIPKIIDVIKTVDFIEPVIDGVEIGWNESGIELVTLSETDEQKIKKNIAFFDILEAEQLGPGIIEQLWNAGYKSINDILNITEEDLVKIDGFGKRKSTIIYNSIQKSIKNVRLSKIQHASNIFKNMGSKKLALLEHFKEKPTIDEVMEIDGIGEILANEYVNNYDIFFDFIKDLPITIEEKVEVVAVSDDLAGMVVVYTGIRDKNSEEVILNRGGKVVSSVSKNTTHLICKDPNSVSSKLEKAKSLGVKIISLIDLYKLIKMTDI